jgi:asparagine synthase (glutamine-hydrolysing)
MCLHHEKPFPFLGSSIAMSEMFEHVSAHDVRVVLDGTGGDEFFGGYWERYFPAAVRDALRHGDWTWLRESWRHARGERSLMVQGAVQLLTGGRLGGSGLRDLRKRWAPVNFTLGLPNRSLPSTDPLAALHAGFTDTLVRDASPGGQLGEWIWHNDRNSMMWGIEGRSPLLDHRLVRYMGSGYGTKFRREWNKFQLRQLYDALTPLPTQWRQQKQGFRWNRKAFLRDNAKAIFEIIGDSGYLRSRFNVGAFLDRARKSKRLLVSGVTPRLLCLAGMDAQLGMDAG